MQLRTQRGSTAEGRALGRALASRLGGADLSPSGLPPAAVLIVRRLDGLGPLRVQPRAHRVDAGWERALRSRLGDALGRAARPVNGCPPPGAAAVLFEDKAEMWACLAVALLDGTAVSSWWWRAVLRGGPPPLPALLVREARHVPAVFERLAAWGRLDAAAAALAPSDAEAVLAALVREHALPAALESPASAERAPGRSPSPSSEPPPWRAWTLPAARLPRATHQLLGIGLGLRRAPREVRSASFVRRVDSWRRPSPGGRDQPDLRAATAAMTLRDDALEAEQDSVRRPPPYTLAAEDRGGEDGDPRSYSLGGGREGADPVPGDESAGGGCTTGPPSGPAARSLVSEERSLLGAPASRRLFVPKGRPRPAGYFSPRTDSADGTRLFREHETVGQPPPADSIPEGKKPDSAALASTAREARAQAFADPLPEAPRRPSVWVAEYAFTPGLEGIPTGLGGVLYLIHVALAFDLFATFEEHAGAWAVLELLARALAPDADPDDALWFVLAELDGRPAGVPAPGVAGLAGLVPAIRERLAEALADPSDEAPEALVACPGRLYVTATHVDLTASLDAISLAARRAGLDRDPGWVPTLGRIVTFHFQEQY